MQLTVNGESRPVAHPEELLLWVLRDELGLTGTHYGCGINQCGVCTVLIDGEVTRSCQVSAKSVGDRSVLTLEGLATTDTDGEINLHPVQQAFLDNPLQCGWCLPGHIMCAVALLDKTPKPNADEIEASAGNNLCRCGGYNSIRKAVARAAEINSSQS